MSTSLDALDAIPPDQIPAALVRLSARLLDAPGPEAGADDLLSVAEAATLLKATKRWMYDHATELGAIRLSRRKIVFPRRTVLARVARKGRRS